MKWLAGLLVLTSASVAFLAIPASSVGDATECRRLEASLRDAAEYNTSWTQQQKNEYVEHNSAQCWEEAHEQEAFEARENEQIAREEAEEAAAKTKREETKQHRIEREQRELAREEREAWQQAHRRIPTVRENEAERLVRAVLHEKEPTWAFRRSGIVDCNGGRINRTHWRCRIRWQTRSYMDWCGRAQVIGEEFEDRRPFFRVVFRARPCYGY